jgi:hypothetical protein
MTENKTEAGLPVFKFTAAEAAGIKSTSDALRYIDQAAEGFNAAQGEVWTRQAQCAMATDVAVRTGLFGSGEGQITRKAFASKFRNANGEPVGGSNVTRWVTMGHLLVVLRYAPNSPEFRKASQYVTVKEVRELAESLNPTNEQERKAARETLNKRVGKAEADRNSSRGAGARTASEKPESKTPEEAVAEVAATVDPMTAYRLLTPDQQRSARGLVVAETKDWVQAPKPASQPRPQSKGRKVQPRTSKQVAAKAS